jgi:hypothetical protein
MAKKSAGSVATEPKVMPSREVLQQRVERARRAAEAPTQISANRLDPILDQRRRAGEKNPTFTVTMVFDRFTQGKVGGKNTFGDAMFVVGREIDVTDGVVAEQDTVVLLSGHLEFYLTRPDASGEIPVPVERGDLLTLIYAGRGAGKTRFGERDDIAKWTVANLTTGRSSADIGGFELAE